MRQTKREFTVEVADQDGSAAKAQVETSNEADRPVSVVFPSASQRVAPQTRRDLVDAVVTQPDVKTSDGLKAYVPVGDSDTVLQIQDHSEDFQARAAGSTSVIDAELAEEDSP